MKNLFQTALVIYYHLKQVCQVSSFFLFSLFHYFFLFIFFYFPFWLAFRVFFLSFAISYIWLRHFRHLRSLHITYANLLIRNSPYPHSSSTNLLSRLLTISLFDICHLVLKLLLFPYSTLPFPYLAAVVYLSLWHSPNYF